VEAAEEFAERWISAEDLQAVADLVAQAMTHARRQQSSLETVFAYKAAFSAAWNHPPSGAWSSALTAAQRAGEQAASAEANAEHAYADVDALTVKAKARQCGLIRDIFHAFQPVAKHRRWLVRNGAAYKLAAAIYVNRRFSEMPLLADALEEVGCDNAEILGHCRNPEIRHAKGCFVLDAVLGRE
jgi:hypothetical protein